jgi:hypothetical protein
MPQPVRGPPFASIAYRSPTSRATVGGSGIARAVDDVALQIATRNATRTQANEPAPIGRAKLTRSSNWLETWP